MSCTQNGNAAANSGSRNGIAKLAGQGSLATAGKILNDLGQRGVVRALTGQTEIQRQGRGLVAGAVRWGFGQTDFQKRYRAAQQAYAVETGRDFKAGRVGRGLKRMGQEALGVAAYQKELAPEARALRKAALNQVGRAAGSAARGAFRAAAGQTGAQRHARQMAGAAATGVLKAATGQTDFQKRQRSRVTGFVREICGLPK